MDKKPDTIGMDALQFYRIMQEIRLQPSWRRESDKAADYYDDNQIDADLAEDLKSKGMGPLITNLIKPTINVVLGQEAKNRLDWRVTGDSDDQQDLCEALSAKLNEAERESRADRACSDAYAGQIKTGIGWVEVSRESDPFRYKYRVQAIHRREIYWDWAAKNPDLSDARYMVRQRWFHIDALKVFLPDHADIIAASGGGWTSYYMDLAKENVHLMHAFDQENRIGMNDWQWRDTTRSQVSLYEVWYKTTVSGNVIDLPDGRTVEVDMKNPMHQLAIANGLAVPRHAAFQRTRVSLWCGPHKLEDYDYGTRNYPYIPFFGYREDLTGVPYGVIRSMIPLQDEVNARRRKLLWLLSSKRVKVDSDALDTRFNDFSDLVAEVSRPDAVIVQNPDRRNANGIEIDDQAGLANQQFEIMNEAKQGIQEVAGVFNAQLGRDSGATSGLAINSLVEQGNAALAEVNDNYRYARMAVGEALLELLMADMSQENDIAVVTDSVGTTKKVILNQRKVDPATGMDYRENDVSKALVKVALHDVPSTPAYRAQQMTTLGETLKSLPPELQAPLIPFYIESTDLPKRKEMAGLIRKQLGMGDDGQQPDPEKEQMAQQLQLLQEQIQEITATGADTVKELEAQASQAEQALKNKEGELQLKAKDQELKESEAERSAMLEQQRLELDRDQQAIERMRIEKDAEFKQFDMQDKQATREQQAAQAEQQHQQLMNQPQPEERDTAAEMEAIKQAIEQAVKPLADKVEAISTKQVEPTSSPQTQPAPIINVTIDSKTGAVKKRIDFEYDDKGNLKAGTATEEQSSENT